MGIVFSQKMNKKLSKKYEKKIRSGAINSHRLPKTSNIDRSSQIPGFIKLPVGGLCYAHVYRVRYYRWLADIKTEALFNDLLFCAPLNPLLGDGNLLISTLQ